MTLLGPSRGGGGGGGRGGGGGGGGGGGSDSVTQERGRKSNSARSDGECCGKEKVYSYELKKSGGRDPSGGALFMGSSLRGKDN